MPLNLYPNIYASGKVPADWVPQVGAILKVPVRDPDVLRYLRQLLPGKWQKVYRYGDNGEVHYFEHASGQVADVKFQSYE
jgi:hypothetical protein